MNIAQIHAQIDQAVRQGGGSPQMENYLRRSMNAESAGDTQAENRRSTATGLFQFIDSTWRAYGGGGNIFNVTDQCNAMVRLTLDNERTLTRVLGRAPTPGEYYLAHFAGPGGAEAVLEASPDTRLQDIPIMRAACRSNPHIRNFTAGQLRAWTAGRMDEEVSLSGGGDLEEERRSRRQFMRDNREAVQQTTGALLSDEQINSMDVMGQLFTALFMAVMSRALEQPQQGVTTNMTMASADGSVPPPERTPPPASRLAAAERSGAPALA